MYSVMSRVLLRVVYGSLIGVLAGWLLREAACKEECDELRAEMEKLRRELESQRGETPASVTPPSETQPADATPDGAKPAEAAPESIMETVKEAVAEVVADIAEIFNGPETVAVTGDSETAKRAIERGLTIPTRRGEDTDDLEAITGIGPVISLRLQELGIVTFRQIALLTEEQTVLVGEALQVFKERISRENWIAQAREQHEKKYGEAL